jgi:NAD(P)H-dependent FMN reductase
MVIDKKKILAIIGSASINSANLKLVEQIKTLTNEYFDLTIYIDLKSLPHFDPQLSSDHPPPQIIDFRKAIEQANGLLICTPEYIFSIPSGLKNAIEWCIATTVFMDKPTGLITASAHGQKGHEELQMIMQTAMAKFTNETTLLIQGISGKFDQKGNLVDTETQIQLHSFIEAFKNLVSKDS